MLTALADNYSCGRQQLLFGWCELDRHPGESLAVLANVPDAGEGQVHATDQHFFPGCHAEGLLAGDDGLLAVVVVFEGGVGTGELDRMVMHQVAEDQHFFAAVGKDIAVVAGGVAVGIETADAWQQFLIAGEGLPLATAR